LLFLNLLWGFWSLLSGIFVQGYLLQNALRTFVFNFYPLYIYIGIGFGRSAAIGFGDFISLWKKLTIIYSVYALCFIVLFNYEIKAFPSKNIDLFNSPSMSPFLPLSILVLWPNLNGRWKWIALIISTGIMLFAVGRAAILGFLGGMLVWFILNLRAAFRGTLKVVVIILILILIGSSINVVGPHDRSLGFDPIYAIARLAATISPQAASELLGQRGYYLDLESWWGTAYWRSYIWGSIIDKLTYEKAWLTGLSHGASLAEMTLDQQDIFTPHNFIFFALFYTGSIGAIIYCMLLIIILKTLFKLNSPILKNISIILFIVTIVLASFGNFLETPFGAVPFYLLNGLFWVIDMRETSNNA